jgi:hypothetical protein
MIQCVTVHPYDHWKPLSGPKSTRTRRIAHDIMSDCCAILMEICLFKRIQRLVKKWRELYDARQA